MIEQDRISEYVGDGYASVHTRVPGGSSRSKSAHSTGPPAAAVPPAPPAAAAAPERHPHIDEALESMRAAKHHLETAEHDFDGHRVKAIEHRNQAIHEAEVCMSMP